MESFMSDYENMLFDESIRRRASEAARYLIKVNPDKYYCTYDIDGVASVWERTGEVMDWLITIIPPYNSERLSSGKD